MIFLHVLSCVQLMIRLHDFVSFAHDIYNLQDGLLPIISRGLITPLIVVITL